MQPAFHWKATPPSTRHAHRCPQLYPSRGAPCSQPFTGRPRRHRQDTLKGVYCSTLHGEFHAACLSLEGHATIVEHFNVMLGTETCTCCLVGVRAWVKTPMMTMMMIFCVSGVVGDRIVAGSKARNAASGGTDPPPEPSGAGPPSTCARHGTVFGTAPAVPCSSLQTACPQRATLQDAVRFL